MTALPPVPNVIKMIDGYVVGDDNRALVITHWKYSGGPPTVAQLNALWTVIATREQTVYPPIMHPDNQLATLELLDLSSDTGASYSNDQDATGTSEGEPLPGEVAVLVNYQTARRWRGGHPRSYYPFGTASNITDPQNWGGAFTDNVLAAVQDVASHTIGFTSGSFEITSQVVVQYWQGLNPPIISPNNRAKNQPKPYPGGPNVVNITGQTVNGKPASQRRRATFKR